jgi:hypothetical protein
MADISCWRKDNFILGRLFSTPVLACAYYTYLKTSRLWPRVRSYAPLAPVILGSLTRKTERCAPPVPPIAASLIYPTILITYGGNTSI